MLVLTMLRKTKKMRLKFCRGSVTVLSIMGNYQEARVKLTIKKINWKAKIQHLKLQC